MLVWIIIHASEAACSTEDISWDAYWISCRLYNTHKAELLDGLAWRLARWPWNQ